MYFIYKEGSQVPYGTPNLALGPSIKNLNVGSIPATVTSVILLNGFNFQLYNGILPSSVQVLYVGDIKKPISNGSIPTSVSTLFLLYGFNQKISEIPPNVTNMYFGDIHLEGILFVYINHLLVNNNLSPAIIYIIGKANNNKLYKL
ncbi:hypothetical protein ACTFIY_005967 [Dictyostelium cf. discoideum]